MTVSRNGTVMAQEWRIRLAASRRRRRSCTPDPQLPGMYWTTASRAKHEHHRP